MYVSAFANRQFQPYAVMQMRKKLNLTIHPDIRTYAEALAKKRRRSISQLFEDLVEAEWVQRENELK
ncbi:MAG: hypothetical protein WCQ57_09525, partial [Verrucomicrobiota bacterium]